MNSAFIKIWDEVVGAVAWDNATGIAGFEFEPKFKSLNWDLAPIKMPIKSAKNIYRFPELRSSTNAPFDTFKGLPGLLADVLPDNYGNQLINVWLASQGRPPHSMNPVEMLCFIGTRGMGALEFEPASQIESKNTFHVEVEELVAVAKNMISQKSAFSTKWKKNEDKAVKDILKIGTSAGGARPKAVIAFNESTREVRSGQTKAPKDFEHWLLKLDGVSNVQLGKSTGYGRVEMAYYNMAISCGIDIMPSKLLEENGRAHFMTKRFDREEGHVKHHVQTLCAMAHMDFNEVTSYSYEQLFEVMRRLKLNYVEAEQMFRRMVFNVISRNCDDHTKNFSFRLKKDGVWELAPAYDLCHAYKPNHIWVSQHALSVNGKRKNITKKDLATVGASISCKNAIHIINEIEEVILNWKKFAEDVDLDKTLKNEIHKSIMNWN